MYLNNDSPTDSIICISLTMETLIFCLQTGSSTLYCFRDIGNIHLSSNLFYVQSGTQLSRFLPFFLATWVINEVAGWWLRGPSYLTFPTNIPQLYPLPPSWGQDLQKTPTKCGQWKSCEKLSMYKEPWYTLNTLEFMSCPSICMSLRNLLFNGHIYGYIAVGGGY